MLSQKQCLVNGERSYESPFAVVPMMVIMKLQGDCAGWLPGYSHTGEIYVANYLFNYYLFHHWDNLWNYYCVVIKLRSS